MLLLLQIMQYLEVGVNLTILNFDYQSRITIGLYLSWKPEPSGMPNKGTLASAVLMAYFI